ncbi:MAG: LacI family DNA-binding transcriptional regulator [Porticoccaceae bacterium]
MDSTKVITIEESIIGKKATISDVARLAEVSKKTVSRVINNEPNVGAKTLSKVKKVIEDLNYTPNPQARGLAFSRSFLLAMIYDNPNASFITEAMYGALSQCRPDGYELVVHPCDATQPNLHDDIINFIRRTKIDGVILLPPLSESDDLINKLKAINCHYVRLVSVIADDVAHMVHFNDREAVTNIAEHLIKLGHTEIGFIKGPANSKSSTERHQAFNHTLELNGIHLASKNIVIGANTFQSGVDCAGQLLNTENPPTAIFASNDEMAIGAMVTAQKMGIKIPDELTIIGFDDNPQASKVWPALTTVNLQVKEMGKLATRKLLALCNNDIAAATSIKSELLPTLIERQTTAPPKFIK